MDGCSTMSRKHNCVKTFEKITSYFTHIVTFKTLWSLFMDEVQLPQGYRATLKRQFTLLTI